MDGYSFKVREYVEPTETEEQETRRTTPPSYAPTYTPSYPRSTSPTPPSTSTTGECRWQKETIPSNLESCPNPTTTRLLPRQIQQCGPSDCTGGECTAGETQVVIVGDPQEKPCCFGKTCSITNGVASCTGVCYKKFPLSVDNTGAQIVLEWDAIADATYYDVLACSGSDTCTPTAQARTSYTRHPYSVTNCVIYRFQIKTLISDAPHSTEIITKRAGLRPNMC